MGTAVQYQLETLLQDYDALASGSALVNGYAMKWEVTGSDPKKLTMYVYETSSGGGTAQLAPSTGYVSDSDATALSPTYSTTGTVADTLVFYVADPTP